MHSNILTLYSFYCLPLTFYLRQVIPLYVIWFIFYCYFLIRLLHQEMAKFDGDCSENGFDFNCKKFEFEIPGGVARVDDARAGGVAEIHVA